MRKTLINEKKTFTLHRVIRVKLYLIKIMNRTIMKKSLLALVMMVFAMPSFAQLNSGGFSLEKDNLYYGIRIGMTSATVGGDVDLNAKVGMTLAGVVGMRVSNTNPLFVESGLYYTQRGGKKGGLKVGLNYLELPILIKYGFKASDDIAILPFFGPYFAYGVSGKYKLGDEKFSSYKDKAGFKHGDMGFKLGCGAEDNKMYLELGYQFGVANISSVDNISAHGNAFIANIGINF